MNQHETTTNTKNADILWGTRRIKMKCDMNLKSSSTHKTDVCKAYTHTHTDALQPHFYKMRPIKIVQKLVGLKKKIKKMKLNRSRF